jgi:phospholipid/cholesterol/gamma-HCH transport system ATP-binding protein
MTDVVDIRNLWSVVSPSGGVDTVIHKDLNLRIEKVNCCPWWAARAAAKLCCCARCWGWRLPSAEPSRCWVSPADALTRAGAASRVGMLFQHGALYSAFTVLENIAFPLRELKTLPDDLVRDAALVKLQMVGLDPVHAHKMPSDLSGGMIKRVALARALIMDPPLLLLDEPTAGLDPDSADAFCTLIRSLHRELGLTVVMVTHDLDTIFEISTACGRGGRQTCDCECAAQAGDRF